jgi:hypothetical protein
MEFLEVVVPLRLGSTAIAVASQSLAREPAMAAFAKCWMPNQGLPQDDDSGIAGTTREILLCRPSSSLLSGALAAGTIIQRAVKEVRRINAELDRVKEGRAIDGDGVPEKATPAKAAEPGI